MTKYFDTPFADSGDKTIIPDATQPSGQISYEQGYGTDYEKDQTTDPTARDIDRQEFNQLFFDATEAIAEIQEFSGLPYRVDVNYPVNARAIGSDNDLYKTLIVNGPDSIVVDPVGDLTGTWEEFTTASNDQGANLGKNKLINGGFQVNQRVFISGDPIILGEYGHDRWRAGAGGVTYTFATVNNVTTATITAGTLEQEIEGVNLVDGDYTLSWGGTAQGQIDGGGFAASPITATLTGGTNAIVEFDTGTLELVQLEPGLNPTEFEHRFLDQERSFCRKYYWVIPAGSALALGGGNPAAFALRMTISFPVEMRITPTVTHAGTVRVNGETDNYIEFNTVSQSTAQSLNLVYNTPTGFIIEANAAYFIDNQTNDGGADIIEFDAEL